MSWETEGIYGYAEEWFAANGYTWALKREQRGKRVYTVKRDGVSEDYEIPACVTNPKAFMESFPRFWELVLRTR